METTFEGWNEWAELANCAYLGEPGTEELHYMLEAFDVCDKIENMFFRTSRDHDCCEVKFEFCEQYFEFQSRNDGGGWGPVDPNEYSVYPICEAYQAMFWIACELMRMLQDG